MTKAMTHEMSCDLEKAFEGISSLDKDDIALRATSYWDASPLEAAKLLLPKSTEEVSRILAACNAAGQTVVVQGGRTGCAGGAVSAAADVVLSLEKMNAVEEIDEIGQTVTVQSGVVLEALQSQVAARDLFLPLDLGARGSCMIGGNIATNAGGVNVIRYGMMRNLVLGLEAVLPDGRVISSMKRMLKDNSGYDLKQLFIGAEGTLGVITRAILKLEPRVAAHETALVSVASYDAVLALLALGKKRLGASLTSFELMWGDYYRAVAKGLGVRPPIADGHPYYVLIEIEAGDETGGGAGVQTVADRLMALLETAMADDLVTDGVLAQSEQERREIWRIRDDFEPILREKPVYLYDVSMPVQNMQDYIHAVEKGLARFGGGAVLHVFGHIGDGNLHLFVHPGPSHAGDDARARLAAEECVYHPLRGVEGSISAEHGIGREKKRWLGVSRSAEEIAVMKALKRTFDPKNILNPGVVFDL